jgi:hypothetical protein
MSVPALHPLGLVLHRDGRFSHEGVPIRHPRLRAAFERSVRYLPEAGIFVVQLGRFAGWLEVEEAGFFVRAVDLDAGTLVLSDGSTEPLDPATLRPSVPDPDALLCRVKPALVPGGLAARFELAAQAELLLAVEPSPAGPVLRLGGRLHPLPALG